VLAETVRVARQRLSEALSGVQEELNAVNLKVKNLKSQLARSRNPEPGRMAELREQVSAGETRAAELRKEILRLEKQRVDEKDLRKVMGSFQEVWRAMNIEEQRALLGQLVEKVGYDGRTGKVKLSFKSVGLRNWFRKGQADEQRENGGRNHHCPSEGPAGRAEGWPQSIGPAENPAHHAADGFGAREE
jgi:hypothetical protein